MQARIEDDCNEKKSSTSIFNPVYNFSMAVVFCNKGESKVSFLGQNF